MAGTKGEDIGFMVRASERCLSLSKQSLQAATAEVECADEDKKMAYISKALEQAKEALQPRPRWAEGHLQLARCLQVLKTKESLKEALEHCQRAFELDPRLHESYETYMNSIREDVSNAHRKTLISIPSAVYAACSIQVHGADHPSTVVVAACKNAKMYAVCMEKSETLFEMTGHEDSVTTLAYCEETNTLASGSLDMSARTWDLSFLFKNNYYDKQEILCSRVYKGHSNRVNDIRFSEHGAKMLTCSTDSTVRVWSTDSGECLHVLAGHSSLVSSISLCASNTILASASGDSDFRLWDIERGSCVEHMSWDSGPVVLCRFVTKGDGKEFLLTAHAQLVQQEARILMWDVIQEEHGWVDGKLSAPCLSIDGLHGKPTSIDTVVVKDQYADCEGAGGVCLLAAACSNGFIHIWDIEDDPLKLMSFSLESGAPYQKTPEDVPYWRASSLLHASHARNLVLFNSSGTLLAASGSQNHSIVIWDVEEGKASMHLFGHSECIRELVWRSEYELLSVSEDGRMCEWSLL